MEFWGSEKEYKLLAGLLCLFPAVGWAEERANPSWPSLNLTPACESLISQACQKSYKVLKLKREMKIFHWFRDSYHQNVKPEKYLHASLETYLNPGRSMDPGAANTAGLYAATDAKGTCDYGNPRNDSEKSEVAVITIPAGTRVLSALNSVLPIEARQELVAEGCGSMTEYGEIILGPNQLYESQFCPRLVLPKHPHALNAYNFPENTKSERQIFGGGDIAFTLGKKVTELKGAGIKVYTLQELREALTLEQAAIAHNVLSVQLGNPASHTCEAIRAALKTPFKFSEDEITAWQKKYLIGQNGSREIFEVETSEEGTPAKPAATHIKP